MIDPTEKFCILMSYWYYRNVDVDAFLARLANCPKANWKLVVDSGAYTALTMGVNIDIKTYSEFIKKYRPYMDHYVNLDVVYDAEATLENQKRMEDEGLKPMPVFHVTEPWSYLEYYVENYDYIGLGFGGQQGYRPKVVRWLAHAFKIINQKPGVKVHGFGITNKKLFEKFYFYSTDSSTYMSATRYGRFPLWNDTKGKFETFMLKKGYEMEGIKLAQYLRDFNYDLSAFPDLNRATRIAIIAHSYMNFGKYIQQMYGKPYDFYFVLSSGLKDFPPMVEAYFMRIGAEDCDNPQPNPTSR